MANTKLQYEDGQKPASQVTVHYDGKIRNFEVDENGTVEVENREQARQLKESHGKFFPINEEELESMDHVLADKTVDEAEEYVADIEKVSRLKELRQEEDRKTAVEVIDQRIAELKEQEQETAEAEENQDKSEESVNQDDEVSKQDEAEDGEETEDK